jgi:hypothetical protein
MAWHMLEDGWRDESSEGPYTETLQTKGPWTIVRLTTPHRRNNQFLLKNSETKFEQEFNTVEEAKGFVSAQEAPAPMKDLTITIAGGAGTGKRATALAIKQLLEANGATVVFADLNEGLPADELLALAPEVFPRLNVMLKTVQTQRLSAHTGPAEVHRGPIYIAWNAAKTQGFATTDYQLAQGL